jgi:hypothetical protein
LEEEEEEEEEEEDEEEEEEENDMSPTGEGKWVVEDCFMSLLLL